MMAAVCATAAIYKPTYNFQFASKSRLSEGNWVKIRTADSGVYEISYDRLREMGFSNPEAVGVYGNGGREISTSFISSGGHPLYRDDLQPVAVLHSGDKLYFYATGPAHISFDGTKFVRESINLYSLDGVYFLSDSAAPLEMARETVADPGIERSDLWDYAYHELDLCHGLHNYGRFYWGEDFLKEPELEFAINLPWISGPEYGRTDKARFDYSLAIAEKDTLGVMEISIGDFSDSHSTLKKPGKVYAYAVRNLSPESLQGSKIRFAYTPHQASFMALDYWLLTYPKRLPADQGKASEISRFVQERVFFHNQSTYSPTGHLRVPEGSVALSVNDPWNPTMLNVDGGKAIMSQPDLAREVIVFDPAKPQKQIKPRFEKVAAQNLHSYREEGCDLLIFSIPKMLPYARQIAELHRRYDGLRSVIVTPEEVHNEFGGGLPDPMAYRAFAKMLHTGPGRSCANILFLGPIRDDVRQISVNISDEAFPAYPALSASSFDNAEEGNIPSVIDFSGYAGDDLGPSEKIESCVMDMGVGVLPISTDRQGELAVSKIEEYLKMMANGEMAAVANRTVSIGCPGNSHGHNRQAVTYGEFIQAYANTTSGALFPHQNVVISDYSKPEANLLFREEMEKGVLYSIYYGHAGPSGLTDRFWQTQDFINLRNRYLGFMLMAGCELSLTDMGNASIGDLSVTDAPRGLIGSIVSTRTVWSAQNETFAREFLNRLFMDESGVTRKICPTIGEVYALAKGHTDNNNALCFYLVGDPALRFPIALQAATAAAAPRAYVEEEVVTVSGDALIPNKSDKNLGVNGKVMVRICRPIATHRTLEYSDRGDELWLTSPDTGIDVVTAMGEVRGGNYSVSLTLPAEVANYRTLPSDTAARLPIHVSIYDPTNRLAYAASTSIELARLGEPADPSATFDEQAPEVAVSYDDVMGMLKISATDNVGFAPVNGVDVRLDGSPFQLSFDLAEPDLVSTWERTVPMLRLEEGDHRVTARVTDAAGNVSEYGICEFRVGPAPSLSLRKLSSASMEEIWFGVEGASADVPLWLRVVDGDNNEVYVGEASGLGALCPTEGWTPGDYRAAIFEEGANGGRRHSPWVSFSIIR